METLVQDVRYALRQFVRRPGFTGGIAGRGWIPAWRASKVNPITALRYE